MTNQDILLMDIDFQKLMDAVVKHNTSGLYTHWHEVWSRVIKPLNDTLKVCGFGAKNSKLDSYQTYEDMQRGLECLTTLK